MGWIPLTEVSIWFDLNRIPWNCRSWYYHGIYAIEEGFLSAKRELNGVK